MSGKPDHSPIMRGLLHHLPEINSITRKGKAKRTTKYTPSPFGLFVALCLAADYKTGLVDASIEALATKFGIHVRVARRILDELIDAGYIVRLFSRKPLLFIRKFPIWNNKECSRLCIEMLKDQSYRIYSITQKGIYEQTWLYIYPTYTSDCVKKEGPIRTKLLPQSLKFKRLPWK